MSRGFKKLRGVCVTRTWAWVTVTKHWSRAWPLRSVCPFLSAYLPILLPIILHSFLSITLIFPSFLSLLSFPLFILMLFYPPYFPSSFLSFNYLHLSFIFLSFFYSPMLYPSFVLSSLPSFLPFLQLLSPFLQFFLFFLLLFPTFYPSFVLHSLRPSFHSSFVSFPSFLSFFLNFPFIFSFLLYEDSISFINFSKDSEVQKFIVIRSCRFITCWQVDESDEVNRWRSTVTKKSLILSLRVSTLSRKGCLLATWERVVY